MQPAITQSIERNGSSGPCACTERVLCAVKNCCANFSDLRNTAERSVCTVCGDGVKRVVKNCCANFPDLRNKGGWSVCTAVQKQACAKTASYSTGILSPGWRFAHLPPFKNHEYQNRYHRQKNTLITPKRTPFDPLMAMRPPCQQHSQIWTVRPVSVVGYATRKRSIHSRLIAMNPISVRSTVV